MFRVSVGAWGSVRTAERNDNLDSCLEWPNGVKSWPCRSFSARQLRASCNLSCCENEEGRQRSSFSGFLACFVVIWSPTASMNNDCTERHLSSLSHNLIYLSSVSSFTLCRGSFIWENTFAASFCLSKLGLTGIPYMWETYCALSILKASLRKVAAVAVLALIVDDGVELVASLLSKSWYIAIWEGTGSQVIH